MPIINTNNHLPGMGGLIMYRKETGIPMAQFVDVVLTGPSELSRYERELVCAFISFSNKCEYCFKSHTAMAVRLSGKTIDELIFLFENYDKSDFDIKTRLLLLIAENVRIINKSEIKNLVEKAQNNGFSEQAVHDLILTASLACMFNRYVDGLEARLPENENFYSMIAEKIAVQGYSMAGRM